jgi:hypothetical protein
VRFQEIARGLGNDARSSVGVVIASICCDPLLVLYDKVDGQGRIANLVIPTDNYDGPAGIVVHLSMRDSATSAMRGWEQQKPDGFTSELFLHQLILLES